jgi:hypothetical protein
MVDTPGYIPSPNWNKPEKSIDKAKPRSLMHRQPKGGSTATHIQPPAGKGKTEVTMPQFIMIGLPILLREAP